MIEIEPEELDEIPYQCRMAYIQGKCAARDGWDRRSPYRKLRAEEFWYMGFDSEQCLTKTGDAVEE